MAEAGLDESADPQALIVADLPAIDATITHLRALSDALERTGQGLRGIEVGQWTGEAADAFRARFDESPTRWFTGADAFADAATAVDAFRRTVQRARSEAAHAADVHRAGVEVSEMAARERAAAVDEFDARLAAGGPPPSPLPAFHDPGVPMREQAARILDAARRDRDSAGTRAAQIVQVSAAAAPDPPTGFTRAATDAWDLLAEGDRYLQGIGEGVLDLATTAQAVNPANPANVLHPASYVEGLNSMATGAVTAAIHPAEAVKSLTGTGWGSDPAGALGRVVPSVALGAVTSGAGGIAGSVGRGAARVGRVGRLRGPSLPALPAGTEVPSTEPDPGRPPPKTEDSPDLPARATLQPEYVGEDRGRSAIWGPTAFVHYFDDAEREDARVTVHDGRLFDDEGRPFQSEPGGSVHSSRERSIFVMDPKGNLYLSNHQNVRLLHHSSFLAGAPVAGAGEIDVVNGRVEYISNQSGHYLPPVQTLDQTVNYLGKEGLDVSGVHVERLVP